MKSLLQTSEWVSFKVSQGWKSHEIDGIYVLEKPLLLGGSFLYSPEVGWEAIYCSNPKDENFSLRSKNNLQNFLQNTKKISQNYHPIFFRLEILDEFDEKIVQDLKKHGFIKAFEEIQPEWRQIVDISKSDEEILSQMKPKGRYNIKLAQKHQVEATTCPVDRLNDGVEIFYDLYQQTGKFQNFETRPKKYFLDLVKTLYPKNEAAILIARYNHIPLSALIITYYDKVASYLYGASSQLHKNTMAPYAAHWQAILEAKKRGCKTYDLLAVNPDQPPPSPPLKGGVRGGHKYAGITQFKEQFGGRKVHLIGSWDLVYRPTWYRLFKMAETLRRK